MKKTVSPAVLALADDAGTYPASAVEHFDPCYFDFAWNEDYSRFSPRALLWWDDASYCAYQGEDLA